LKEHVFEMYSLMTMMRKREKKKRHRALALVYLLNATRWSPYHSINNTIFSLLCVLRASLPLLAFFLLFFEYPLVVWCVLLLPVLALAVGAAVPHYPARALLHLMLRTDTTAGAVDALEQFVPLVGTPRLVRDQGASGALAIHVGADNSIGGHAQP
jgi:hypothetical protein